MTMMTLIAADRLDERLLRAALDRLSGARLSVWVEPGSAVDLHAATSPEEMRAAYEKWEGVDVVVHPPGPREKKLLVADMDSTMIGQECIDELADYAGLKPQVAAITDRAMRGELDFADALRERVALLAGLEQSAIGRCLADRVRPSPGAATLVRTMRARGAMTLLVSGGFTAFAEPVAEMLGFDRVEANVLDAHGGLLTGTVSGRIVDSAFKAQALIEARDSLGITADAVMAVGDGANDGPMIEAAGLGLAYRAKPALAALADARLDHHGLDALLWVQGIGRDEWVLG
ncbi:MAG: phosphoserine phosphatase SerB [Pseudomonadota bacterium]|nr:phosphoserine phosphatase SerB [Pseudomonadota bacterium]